MSRHYDIDVPRGTCWTWDVDVTYGVRVVDTYAHPNDWSRLVDEACRRPGWNQTKFAEAAGVNRRTVSRWITGESTQITSTSMALVARATGKDYETIVRAVLGAQATDQMKDDAAIKMIQADPEVDEATKADLTRMVIEIRTENDAALVRQIEILLRNARKRPARRHRKAS